MLSKNYSKEYENFNDKTSMQNNEKVLPRKLECLPRMHSAKYF